MSQKRQQEDGKARAENCPEDKRRKGHTFKNVVQEVMKIQSVQHFLEPVLEPLIRRVVKEEVELALKKHLANMKRNSEKEILGTGMSTKMWEVTVEHARTCVLDKRVYLYCPPGTQQKSGVVFNVVGQVMGLLSECQYVPIDKLSETQKAEAQNLVICAFKHWEEVVSFEDEASLTGSSSHSSNALCTSSLPMTEISNGSKILASHKMDGADYSQLNAASPDIISSIYSVGGVSGLDDYNLIDGLRYDQALSYPGQIANSLICDTDSISQTFCDEDHLRFFDTDLQSQNLSLESPADLQSAVDGFLMTRSTTLAMGKAQRRWTKLFSVLKWFSIRKIVTLKRIHTREIQRYPTGM